MQISAGIAGQLHVRAVGPRGVREATFNNIFTDHGLNYISGTWERSGELFDLYLGEGRAEEPHSSVTNLASQVHVRRFQSPTVVATEVLVQQVRVHTRYVAHVPKGRDWVLREFGAVFNEVNKRLATYALLKDSNGQLTEMAFTKEEEITFTYYVQVTYPKTFTGKVSWDNGTGVVQLDYTGQLGAGDNPNLTNWKPTAIPPYSAGSWFRLATGGGGSGSKSDGRNAGSTTFTESQANGTWRSWGLDYDYHPVWLNFPEPLTKTNTQTLAISVQWRFENAASVPIPEV